MTGRLGTLALLLGSVFAVTSLAACAGDMSVEEAGDDEVVAVNEHSVTAYKVANEAILDTRPEATKLMVRQINLTLANNSIVSTTLNSSDVESLIGAKLTNGQPDKTCPYLSKPTGNSTLTCRYLVDRALENSLAEMDTVTNAIEQDVSTKHGTTLAVAELAYVKSWIGEAALSGIDVAAIHSMELLRSAKVCDQAPTPEQSAFSLGEKQGKALLEKAEPGVLAATPKTQCNTDIIANAVLAEAQKGAENFKKTTAICEGFQPADLEQQVDLTQAEGNRKKGIDAGLKAAYEALRVRLVSSWKCEPPPPPPTITNPTAPTSQGGECLCYARYSGKGPVYCFAKNDFTKLPPKNGVQLANMDKQGVPQCQGTSQATPVGSPLVVDLDDDGIKLGASTVRFDLAATGEQARIPALGGKDALLALDRDGNGRIDTGLELFGNTTLCGHKRCVDGIEALAQHDANKDGRIDARDPVFARLRLWHDANADGQTQAGELSSLSEAGLRTIMLTARLDRAWANPRGSAARSIDFVREDGRRGAVHDVWFTLSFDKLPTNPRSSGITSSLLDRR